MSAFAGAKKAAVVAVEARAPFDELGDALWTFFNENFCRCAINEAVACGDAVGAAPPDFPVADSVNHPSGPHGADPPKKTHDGFPAAQIRFTAKSDDVLAIASDPGSFARAWLSGKLKVEGNFFDLLNLRKMI